MLTHANLTAACAQYMETTTRHRSAQHDGGPGAHPGGAAAVPHLRASAVMICSASAWARSSSCIRASIPPRSPRTSPTKRISVFPGVPTMHVALLSLPGDRQAGPVVAQVLRLRAARRCRSRCSSGSRRIAGCRLTEGWGMSETSPCRHVHARATGAREAPAPAALPHARHQDEVHRRREPGARGRVRRARRNLHQGPERDERLLEAAGSDRRRR